MKGNKRKGGEAASVKKRFGALYLQQKRSWQSCPDYINQKKDQKFGNNETEKKMRFSKFAFVGTQFACRRQQSAHPSGSVIAKQLLGGPSPSIINQQYQQMQQINRIDSSRLFSSPSDEGQLTNIDKAAMQEIVEDYEEGGREDSGYVIMDVREEHEVAATGKVSPNTITFPLQKLMQYNAFKLEPDEFEEVFGFEKPTPDETLVFSCAAGIRSVHAAQIAAMGGYTKLVNYMGGANDWFY